MICISICARTSEKACRDIRRAVGLGDILELRMDEIAEGNLGEWLDYIAKLAPGKHVLVTHRKTKPETGRPKALLGRSLEDNEKATQRWRILQDAVRLGVAYVDVELEDDDQCVDVLKTLIRENGNRTKLVCSHHDFAKTPSLSALKCIYRACVEKGADVVKIVPYARTAEDNIRIFRFLTWAVKQGKAVVAFGMGEKGRLSRVAAPLFGAAFTFAALDERSAAAPGQIAAKEMAKMLDVIERKGS